jgi:hypothetical protein
MSCFAYMLEKYTGTHRDNGINWGRFKLKPLKLGVKPNISTFIGAYIYTPIISIKNKPIT